MRGGTAVPGRVLRRFFPLAISVLAACSQPAARGSVDLDVAAIREAHAKLDDAARRGDYAGWSSRFTPDAVIMPPGMPPIVGERGLRQFFDARPENLEGGSDLLDVEVVGDLAIVRGRYLMRGIAEGASIEDLGKMLEVWQRQTDGRWLLARDIWNSDLPTR